MDAKTRKGKKAFRKGVLKDMGGPARIPYGELKGVGKGGKELAEKTLQALHNRGWE